MTKPIRWPLFKHKVRDLSSHKNKLAKAQTIIQSAQNLGLVTIAEGVENSEQQQSLQKMGCDELQGYLFCRPQPPDIIEHTFFTNKSK